MVSSMGGNVPVDIVDGNVASKAGDVDDNGGMTCGEEVFRGGVEYTSGMKAYSCGVEYSCGMEVSGVVWNTRVVWKSHQWNHLIDHHPAHQLDQVNQNLTHHFSLNLGSATS